MLPSQSYKWPTVNYIGLSQSNIRCRKDVLKERKTVCADSENGSCRYRKCSKKPSWF